ncbi:nuclear body protein SP140-like protein, partial [Phyllostomus hastatus]|uniref:nuclear body protein SP140-like protein n=1 Tax=Phyllostomus hastatus TaxID=9423 RepID=UPI001E680FC2
MSAEDRRLMCEIALKLFKEHKVDISHAIKTIFPFFEKLRDCGLITNEKYEESRKSCKNQVPVPKVVYDVFSELEEKYHLPLLEILFNKVIMNSYPDLNGIHKGFRDEIQKKIFHQESDEGKSADNPNIQLKLVQGTGENSSSSLSWLFPDLSSCTVISIEASAKFGDGDKLALPQASTSALTREPESMDLRKSPTSGNIRFKRVRSPEGSSGFSAQEKRPEAGSSAVRGGADQQGPLDLGKSPTSPKAKKKRWLKKHEGEFVDFRSEILPVTCGDMKGMLHKKKLEEGSTVKCIKTEDGNWFTPQEFEAAGNYKSSRNWKNTVRCGGKTLKRLMEEGKLPIPPTMYSKKKKLEKPQACEVCHNGEDLFGCDTCSRFFHGDCHIPPVQNERPPRSPWSCTFCRIKESSGSQQSHGEWEVLAMTMGPKEQLKCEFLLLEIYCHSDNISLEQMEQDTHSVEAYRGMDNFMLLHKIKKNLNERHYPKVGSFMKDMRLIFQNHRAFNKNHALYLMGIDLAEEFEQNFRKVFATSAPKMKPGTVDLRETSTPQEAKKKTWTGEQPGVPVDFQAEILPVTCKENMGLLIKRKLERGATRKCIRTEDGNWFTPREFEIRGGYGTANNWRNNLTCGGKPLRLLIELGFIHPPPITKKVENSGTCVICQDGGKLVGCGTCPRVFHEGCHLPPVEIRRNAWKCTYCTIGNPPIQQHYRESEVLVKVMGPEEKLKCAFLLLNVYGPLESKVFPNIPHENYVEEASRCLKKLRKLD